MTDDSAESLEFALDDRALAREVDARISEAIDYARRQRGSWRARASGLHVATLGASVSATVLLGLAELEGIAALGFALSAIVTIAAAVEPFFNWRSRWVLAEESLADWYDLRNRLRMYVAEELGELDRETLVAFSNDSDRVWSRLSENWIRQRRSDSESHVPAGQPLL